MKIAQNYHYRGDDWWDWSVWIDATPAELAGVKEVAWHLHPSFSPSTVTTRDKANRFLLKSSGWGTFTIKARLDFADGTSQELSHELELYYEEDEAAPAKTEPPVSSPRSPAPSKEALSSEPGRLRVWDEKYAIPRPRRLLAIDGGGIRSLITLEILRKIETELALVYGHGGDFRLGNYFDYVAGTGTGAIIATGLALGLSVDEISRFFLMAAPAIGIPYRPSTEYRHVDGLSETMMRSMVGDRTLGSQDLKSLLLIVVRNALTGATWPLSNNPFAKYNDLSRPDSNLNFRLSTLLSASVAGEQEVSIGSAERHIVVGDATYTPHNNPAFLLYRYATLPEYRLHWRTGETNLMLISIGSGTYPRSIDPLLASIGRSRLEEALIDNAVVDQDINCRTVGRCLFGGMIDREIGDLVQPQHSSESGERDFLYARFNPEVSALSLHAMGLPQINPENLHRGSSVAQAADFARVGQTYAQTIRMSIFSAFVASERPRSIA